MTGSRRRIAWVVGLTAALLLPGTVPAGAHEHPTPTEVSAPGVVWVEARADVEVSLVEHRQSDPGGKHISIIQSASSPLLAQASGFVVDPTGAVVTSGSITQNDLERASVYAVNEAFQRQYGDSAPMSDDLFARQRVGDDANLIQQRLQACYPPYQSNDAGGCVVRTTATYLVHPHVTSQEEYGQLPAELSPESTADVAVLQVKAGSGMPTVALGESMAGASALSALGFFGVPGEEQLQEVKTHLAEVGGTVLKTEGLTEDEEKGNATLADGLPEGLRGGPVVAERGQVVGFLEPDADSGPPPAVPGRLVDVGVIREVLSAAGVTPRRGPVDNAFEAAMHAYKNEAYAAAIPDLKATLEQYPGHALAAANLAVAEQNVAEGTPGPAAPAGSATAATGSGSGFPWTVVLLAVGGVLLLVAGAVVYRRRQHPSDADPAAPSPGPDGAREGRSPAHSRAAAGDRERQKVPSATGSGSGAVSVLEHGGSVVGGVASPSRSGPAPSGSAQSRSVPRQAARTGVGDGTSQVSRAAPGERGAADAVAFCTTCGAHLGPHHRYCGRCGTATG